MEQQSIIGWGVIGILNSSDGVNNPRPLFTQCLDSGKTGILHLFRKDPSNWKVAVCSEKIRMLHSGILEGGMGQYFKNDDDELRSLSAKFLQCPECLKVWNKPSDESEV